MSNARTPTAAPTAALAAALLATLLGLTACGLPTTPAGQPSRSNVNPETGSRGGSGASS